MRSLPLLGTLILVGACGRGSFPVALTASPAAAPTDVIACVRAKLAPLGYQQTSFDQTDFRVTARKVDNSVHRADPQFAATSTGSRSRPPPAPTARRRSPSPAARYAEFETQRGPTEEEEKASADVKQARRPSSTPAAGPDPAPSAASLPRPPRAPAVASPPEGD